MLTKRDEILIQRCVDGEISADERRELLQRIEELPDGWKTLACSFMEDRLFASAACDLVGPVARPLSLSANGRSDSASESGRRHWFYHPVTSLVLSLCVACLAGLLVLGEVNRGDGTQITATETGPAATTDKTANGKAPVAVSGALVSGKPNYHMRLESDGVAPRELPVYANEQDFLDNLEKYRQRVQASNGGEADRQDSEMHILRIPLENGQTIVVPFEGTVPSLQ